MCVVTTVKSLHLRRKHFLLFAQEYKPFRGKLFTLLGEGNLNEFIFSLASILLSVCVYLSPYSQPIVGPTEGRFLYSALCTCTVY
jgi:hypothetical protein